MAEFGRHILILVPHPDDEVVACAATIRRAKAEGATIALLFLTHGCIARHTLWPWQRQHYEKNIARRKKEALEAARKLDVEVAGFVAHRPARHLWRNLPGVWTDINRVIGVRDIDQVWVPAYEGGNADHDGLNGLASALRGRVSVLEFAEYNFDGGRANSHHFVQTTGTETVLRLTDEEQRFKKALLSVYYSEQHNLGYVKTEREVYRPLIDYDYTKPPHSGTLWYTRFHWVPFKHPRVDFTKPQEVSEAIVKALGN